MTWIQRNFKVTRLIDLATLTGACITALGVSTAGLFSNDDEFANTLLQVSDLAVESAWRLPIKDEHRDATKLDFADLNNVGGAGYFLLFCFRRQKFNFW